MGNNFNYPDDRALRTKADKYIAQIEQQVGIAGRRYDLAKFMLAGYASITVLLLTAVGFLKDAGPVGYLAKAFALFLALRLLASLINYANYLATSLTHIAWLEMQAIEVRAGGLPREDWLKLQDTNDKLRDDSHDAPTNRLAFDLIALIAFLFFAMSPETDAAATEWLKGAWNWAAGWIAM